MKKTTVILSVLIIACFAMIGVLFFSQNKKINIAYITVNSVYNDFSYKKELEAQFNNTQAARKAILDSLTIKLRVMANNNKGKAPSEAFQQLQQEYQYKQQQFAQDNQALSQQYSEQIFKQINQYVRDYGKEYGYDYILGANGSGSIMFANEAHEITKEITEYCNKRYAGK